MINHTIIGLYYTGFWDKEFIDELVKDLNKVVMLNQVLGEPVTPLQQLAYDVLKQNNYKVQMEKKQ